MERQPLVLTEPDWSKVFPAKLLREGLQALRERAEREEMECNREAMAGDMIRLQQQQSFIQEVENKRVDAKKHGRAIPEPVNKDAHDASLAAVKVLTIKGFRVSLYALWEMAERVARFHKLERPPECPLNDSSKQGIHAIADGFRTIIHWCDAQQGKKPGKSKVKPKPRRPPANNELTARQTEAYRLLTECNGNRSEVARRMGVSIPTANQHIDAAEQKLGKLAVHKPGTKSLKTSKRGSSDVSSEDDRRLEMR